MGLGKIHRTQQRPDAAKQISKYNLFLKEENQVGLRLASTSFTAKNNEVMKLDLLTTKYGSVYTSFPDKC